MLFRYYNSSGVQLKALQSRRIKGKKNLLNRRALKRKTHLVILAN